MAAPERKRRKFLHRDFETREDSEKRVSQSFGLAKSRPFPAPTGVSTFTYRTARQTQVSVVYWWGGK